MSLSTGRLAWDRMEDNRLGKVIINSPVPKQGVVTRDSLEEHPPPPLRSRGNVRAGDSLNSRDCRRNSAHLYLLRSLTPVTSASVGFHPSRSRSGQKGSFFIHLVVGASTKIVQVHRDTSSVGQGQCFRMSWCSGPVECRTGLRYRASSGISHSFLLPSMPC